MLQDYVNDYIEAKRNNDTKMMRKIERDLSRVGMDKYTLEIIVATEMQNDNNRS